CFFFGAAFFFSKEKRGPHIFFVQVRSALSFFRAHFFQRIDVVPPGPHPLVFPQPSSFLNNYFCFFFDAAFFFSKEKRGPHIEDVSVAYRVH
ncbi:MAG: hypothetical protein KAX04_02285, partial [Methanomicrobia archaeon]|nr:hypothetical protein [Methanomicrobia archaeon]